MLSTQSNKRKEIYHLEKYQNTTKQQKTKQTVVNYKLQIRTIFSRNFQKSLMGFCTKKN